ncbi:MAG TPA: hypothetical protein VER14_02420, partial [Phototrophicaceae bacterium]|nr:hypothetical protein [Phototrophicaceae bacterium]
LIRKNSNMASVSSFLDISILPQCGYHCPPFIFIKFCILSTNVLRCGFFLENILKDQVLKLGMV